MDYDTIAAHFALQLVEANDKTKILYSTDYTGYTVKDYTDAAKADIKRKYKLKRYSVPDLPIATLNEFKNVQATHDEDLSIKQNKKKLNQEIRMNAMKPQQEAERLSKEKEELTRQEAELDKKKQECKTLLGISGGKKKRKTRSRRVNKRKTKRSF
jgi:hypothetical protein